MYAQMDGCQREKRMEKEPSKSTNRLNDQPRFQVPGTRGVWGGGDEERDSY